MIGKWNFEQEKREERMRSGVLKGFFVVAMAWGLLVHGVMAQDEASGMDTDRLTELLAFTPEKIAQLPADEQEGIRQEVEALLVDSAAMLREQNQTMDDLRIELMKNDPEVQDINEQIKALHLKQRELIMQNADMQALKKQHEECTSQMFSLMKLNRLLVK